MVERNASAGKTGGEGSQPTTPGGMAQQQATQMKEQIQQTAADLKDQVTERATGKLAEQKTAASDSLSTVAHAFRQTGTRLREQEQDGIARYIDRAAGQIEQFGDYLGRRDLRGLAQDTERFARREPALFLGGAFTLGLFAARFLKSSGSASGGAMSGQSSAGNSAATLALPPMSSYRPPATSPPATAAMPATPSPTASAPKPPLIPPTPPSAASGGRGTTPLGGAADEEVLVGGPPIASDIVVGGPPREPGQEPRR